LKHDNNYLSDSDCLKGLQAKGLEAVVGEMKCPPEDCGGVWGYAEMLEILKQPDHEEYESNLEWLGDEFDPEYFNKDEVNKWL